MTLYKIEARSLATVLAAILLWAMTASGGPIRLRSAVGEFTGRARFGIVARGCLVALWPEANVLIARRYDPGSGEPDYNTQVTLEKLPGEPAKLEVAARTRIL